MNKRTFLAALAALPFISAPVEAAKKARSVWYSVPRGYTKIRVVSWAPDGSKELDRTISVQPGQKFKVQAIK
jgi:hypothetical protein